MKIAYISTDWGKPPRPAGMSLEEYATVVPLPGGAGWYRCRVPGDALRAAGHEVLYCGGLGARGGRILPMDWKGEVYDDFEVIVLQRWMHPDAARVITEARERGQTVIQDLDDWMWGLDPANQAFAATHPRREQLAVGKNRAAVRASARRQLEDLRSRGRVDREQYRAMRRGAPMIEQDAERGNLQHYHAAIAASSGIVCSTPYLADRLRERFRKTPVLLVRNALDLARWRWRPPKAEPETIGWVGAVTHRSGDLETLRGHLGPFAERHGLQVVHCGAVSGSSWFAQMVGVDEVREKPMRPITTYPRFFRALDIGLVPLRDAPFNRAKSCIKSMEYAAAGVPFRAAWSPENAWFAPWATARKPNRPLALEALVDPVARQSEAERNLERVAELDIEKKWGAWENAYLLIAGRDLALR